MSPLVDIHTHQPHPSSEGKEVVCLDITELHQTHHGDFDEICHAVEGSGAYVSLGIHPWNAGLDDTAKFMDCLQAVIKNCPNILLIGEAGLDKSRPVDFSLQEEVFRQQVVLSEICRKPMVIHCVRAFDDLLRIRKALHPFQRWIVHGFRGKPQQAEQLLRAGMDISLGERFHPDVPHVVPLDRLWVETDMGKTTISSVYSAIIEALGIHLDLLVESVYRRFIQLTEISDLSTHTQSSL